METHRYFVAKFINLDMILQNLWPFIGLFVSLFSGASENHIWYLW